MSRWHGSRIIKNSYEALRIDVAFSHVWVIIVDVLGPDVVIIWYAYLKPWFHVTVVVNNSCSFYVPLVDVGIVAKPKNMPIPVDRLRLFPECY